MNICFKNILRFVMVSLVVIVIAIVYYNIDPSAYEWVPKCPFFSLTGYKCPGCGTQRAIHEFLHGNLVDGFKYNPLLLPAGAYLITLECARHTKFMEILTGKIASRSILLVIFLYWLLRNLLNF